MMAETKADAHSNDTAPYMMVTTITTTIGRNAISNTMTMNSVSDICNHLFVLETSVAIVALLTQLQVLQTLHLPKPAATLLLGRNVAITRERGTWQSYQGIPLMPTLHPAYVLRQYTPENRRYVWEDLKAALAKVREG